MGESETGGGRRWEGVAEVRLQVWTVRGIYITAHLPSQSYFWHRNTRAQGESPNEHHQKARRWRVVGSPVRRMCASDMKSWCFHWLECVSALPRQGGLRRRWDGIPNAYSELTSRVSSFLQSPFAAVPITFTHRHDTACNSLFWNSPFRSVWGL